MLCMIHAFLNRPFLQGVYKYVNNIYIYIYSSIKNTIIINASCLITDDPLLLCNEDSHGVIINTYSEA